jgi:hypothetical protein
MMHRSPAPLSPAFEAVAQGAQFRDVIAIVVHTSPDVIFQALHEVTLRDMKLAWVLGELRYRPSRLAGHMPAVDSNRPFLTTLIEGGTLVLRDEAPREVITGSAAQLHRLHQAPRRFATRDGRPRGDLRRHTGTGAGAPPHPGFRRLDRPRRQP